MGWKAECHSLGLKGEFQGYVFFRLLVRVGRQSAIV